MGEKTKSPQKRVFITGIAGFIGYHLAAALKKLGAEVIGCDNFNEYYPSSLKREREKLLSSLGIKVIEHDIRQLKLIEPLFKEFKCSHFVHLAAQAGVRYSIDNPHSYIQNNIEGFLEVLELMRSFPQTKLIFASSSSVYGLCKETPFSETLPTNEPISLYAATKKSNELMAHCYHHLYHIPMVGLRFFTAYGPLGRPDMAYFSFSKAIVEKRPIEVFNQGKLKRDFTYIDDIIDGCIKALDYNGAFEIFNLGNNHPVFVHELIHTLEDHLKRKAQIHYKPMQKGDVFETYADITKSSSLLGFKPKTSLNEGIKKFTDWFTDYFKIST